MTMEELQARIDRWKEVEKRWDIRFDLMPALYINAHSKEGSRARVPGESFGHYRPAEEMSDDEMLALMQDLTKRRREEI
jgi:hypothetical protein